MNEDGAKALSAETKKLLRSATTATIAGVLYRKGIQRSSIESIWPVAANTTSFIGTAYTLRYLPAREDMTPFNFESQSQSPLRVASDNISEGEVLVIDCRGITNAGAIGGILGTRVQVLGGAAIVCDGGLRDIGELSALDIPVFYRDRAPPGPSASMYAADVQMPIGCGGVLVFPGDVLVGDEDGVVVIPIAMVDEVAQHAAHHDDLERFIIKRIENGAPALGTYPPSEETKAAYEMETGKPAHW